MDLISDIQPKDLLDSVHCGQIIDSQSARTRFMFFLNTRAFIFQLICNKLKLLRT